MASPPADPLHQDWQRLLPGVLRRLRHYLRGLPEHVVEDTAQEVLVGLHVFVTRSGMPDDLEAVVTTICRRRAASAIRRESRARERFAQDDELAAKVPDASASVEAELVRDECARVAHAVLACFRRHQAPCESIALGRMRGLDFPSISESMGMKADAVRQAWHRCIERLKGAIQRGEVDVLGYDRGEGGLP